MLDTELLRQYAFAVCLAGSFHRMATQTMSYTTPFFMEKMNMHDLIWWILIGIIAGWLAGKIMKGAGFGVLMDMVVGIAGAVVGGFLMNMLGFSSSGGLIYSIVVAVIGAVILIWIVRKIKG